MASKPAVQRKPIELSRKAEILSEVRAGKLTNIEIARKFGIAKSTLTGLVKDSARVTAALSDGDFAPKRKKMRTAAHKGLEDVLLAWIQRARSMNLPVNGCSSEGKSGGNCPTNERGVCLQRRMARSLQKKTRTCVPIYCRLRFECRLILRYCTLLSRQQMSSAMQAAAGSSSGATTVSPATQVQLHAMLHKPAVSTVALAAPTAVSSGATAATLVPTRIMALQQPPGQPATVALKQGLQVIAASAGTAQTSTYTVEGSAATPLVASIVADAAALKPVEGGALPKAIAVAVTTAAAAADNSVVPPNVTAPSSSETITRAVSVDVSAATVQAVQAAIEAARQQGSLPYTMRLRNNPPKPA
ncbi:hypothetical protein HPB51_026406 [Rhipicephalus microplus]|uniref:HTH psq-type domain-containing protein n=1 Tax=Rhipicephalus microplus TaxID=6941 RepID=A0A9J6D347_RHIMP|nr:hypothetical protein HPB51_026406 [Rhipicephalus microplus]